MNLLRVTTTVISNFARAEHHVPALTLTNKTLRNYYFDNLPFPSGDNDKCVAKYVWIDATGIDMRGKSQVLPTPPKSIEECPNWSFDGSSTGQATGKISDMILKPAALFKDPFRLGNSKIVLCDVYDKDGEPAATNHRHSCKEVVDKTMDQDPWFGFEQEYVLLGPDLKPFGWPEDGYPEPQGPYYCSTGALRVYGRDIYETSLRAMLYAGVDVDGVNVEVMPSQLEFQVGIANGVEIADHLWMARYLLNRVAEDFGVLVSYDPKPVRGDWNGSGNHCSMSTKAMREEGGLEVIKQACERLSKNHLLHQSKYDPNNGDDNRRRMTGKHETSHYDHFSWGVGSRASSVRIPVLAAKKGFGWFEDRRPSSNCDPYMVVERILRTVILNQND